MNIIKLQNQVALTDELKNLVRQDMLTDTCYGTSLPFMETTDHRVTRWQVSVKDKHILVKSNMSTLELRLNSFIETPDTNIISISLDFDNRMRPWLAIKLFNSTNNEYSLRFGYWNTGSNEISFIDELNLSGANFRAETLYFETDDAESKGIIFIIQDLDNTEIKSKLVSTADVPALLDERLLTSQEAHMYCLLRRPAQKPILVFR